MLVLDDVTFAHPGQAAPYRFSMRAERGVVTAVSGSSGSGKSTLLDLIAGFLDPIAGTIALDGASLIGMPPERRPVSLLLQSESLFEHLSARDNVRLGLPARTPGAGEEIDRVLARMGLSEIAGQQAATLSGGQKQRVALARTLLRDRPILLLDEPFSALDDTTRQSIRALVAETVTAMNWIAILVSHHADDVAALAGRRYEIADNRLIEADRG